MTDVREVGDSTASTTSNTDAGEGLFAPRPRRRDGVRVMTSVGGESAAASADGASGSPRPRRELRRHRRRVRFAVGLFVVMTLGALAVLGALGWNGYHTVRNIRGGTEVTGITDPAAPGFQAEVKPTPTQLVVGKDVSGHVTDMQLIVSGPRGEGGSVVFIPGSTHITAPDVPGATLSQLYDTGGIVELQKRVEAFLGFAVLETAELSQTQLATLMGAAGPLTIDNPDDLYVITFDSRREVLFRAGSLTLSPDQVATYLGLAIPDEAATNRSSRAQLVWEAWMKSLEDPGRAATLRAESEPVVSDVARTVLGLTTGTTSLVQLPVTRSTEGSPPKAIYTPDPAGIATRVAPLVPFPASAFPGQRTRVRVLEGIEGRTVGVAVTGPLVQAGAEIVVIGNSSTFGQSSSTVRFRDASVADAAQKMADALGLRVGPEIDASMPENVDVSIVLGADFSR